MGMHLQDKDMRCRVPCRLVPQPMLLVCTHSGLPAILTVSVWLELNTLSYCLSRLELNPLFGKFREIFIRP